MTKLIEYHESGNRYVPADAPVERRKSIRLMKGENLYIELEGHGDANCAFGAVVGIEWDEDGKPMLFVWNDKDQEDETQRIYFEDAKLD
jgi:hypothetical protein